MRQRTAYLWLMKMNDRLDLAQAVHGRMRRMHHIARYSSIPVIKPELVSTHSWQMAMIGLLISYDLNEAKPHTVDAGEVVKRCVVHDVSEAMSGDIIRTYKHGSREMEEACKEADHQNMYKLTREFGTAVGDHIYIKWEEAKNDTLAGQIVVLCDAVCVVTYCAEEVRMGNQHMWHVPDDIFNEVLWPMREHPLLGRYIHQLFPGGSYEDAYAFDAHQMSTWQGPSREVPTT